MRFIKQIKNLIRWFPVIWNDFDWDCFYFYIIIKFKLQNIYKRFSEIETNTNELKYIKQCIYLCDRVLLDNYDDTPKIGPWKRNYFTKWNTKTTYHYSVYMKN